MQAGNLLCIHLGHVEWAGLPDEPSDQLTQTLTGTQTRIERAAKEPRSHIHVEWLRVRVLCMCKCHSNHTTHTQIFSRIHSLSFAACHSVLQNYFFAFYQGPADVDGPYLDDCQTRYTANKGYLTKVKLSGVGV